MNDLENPDRNDREARIRERAYALWEAAGRPEGEDGRHWLAACADVDAEDTGNAVPGGDGPDAAPLRSAAPDISPLRTTGSPELAPAEPRRSAKAKGRVPPAGRASRSDGAARS